MPNADALRALDENHVQNSAIALAEIDTALRELGFDEFSITKAKSTGITRTATVEIEGVSNFCMVWMEGYALVGRLHAEIARNRRRWLSIKDKSL